MEQQTLTARVAKQLVDAHGWDPGPAGWVAGDLVAAPDHLTRFAIVAGLGIAAGPEVRGWLEAVGLYEEPRPYAPVLCIRCAGRLNGRQRLAKLPTGFAHHGCM